MRWRWKRIECLEFIPTSTYQTPRVASIPANLDSEALGQELRHKHACVHCPVPSRSPDPFKKPTNPVKCTPGTPCLETALEASPNGAYAGVPRPRIRYSIQTEYTLTVHPFRGVVSLSFMKPVVRNHYLPQYRWRGHDLYRSGPGGCCPGSEEVLIYSEALEPGAWSGDSTTKGAPE